MHLLVPKALVKAFLGKAFGIHECLSSSAVCLMILGGRGEGDEVTSANLFLPSSRAYKLHACNLGVFHAAAIIRLEHRLARLHFSLSSPLVSLSRKDTAEAILSVSQKDSWPSMEFQPEFFCLLQKDIR